jgi:hypothetical protein
MLPQFLQIFLGKEHFVKNWLISALDKVIYFKGTMFQRSTKPLFTSQNRVEISRKNSPLFLLRFLWNERFPAPRWFYKFKIVLQLFGGGGGKKLGHDVRNKRSFSQKLPLTIMYNYRQTMS